jgi:hypothetical protein
MGNPLNNSGVRGGGVAQSSSPAGFNGVPPSGPTLVGTTGQLAPWPAALPEQFTLPNVAEIIGKFGGVDQVLAVISKMQSLLDAA